MTKEMMKSASNSAGLVSSLLGMSVHTELKDKSEVEAYKKG